MGLITRWTGANTIGSGVLLDNGTVAGVSATTTAAAFTIQGTAINDSSGNTTISRGLYITPSITRATDYRALEVSNYTLTIASTTGISTVYGSLFNAPTIATTTIAWTLPNAQTLTITGAPIASASTTISSSTALRIQGSNVDAGTDAAVTNAYSLYVDAPTGAVNNYAAIFNGGNVGIGTTSPTQKLEVNGNMYFTTDGNAFLSTAGTSYFKPASGNTNQAIQLTPLGTGTVSQMYLHGQVSTSVGTRSEWTQSGANTIIRNQTLGGGSQGYISLEQDGSTRMRIDTAGNVGIGTTTPGRTLTVVGDVRATGILYDSSNSAGTSGNFLMSTATGYQWTATSTLFGGAQVTGSGTNGYVTRWTGANTIGSGVLLDNGIVAGINATSSSISFNVQGSGTLDPFNVSSSSGTSIFRVMSGGNVGIGTTGPGRYLIFLVAVETLTLV